MIQQSNTYSCFWKTCLPVFLFIFLSALMFCSNTLNGSNLEPGTEGGTKPSGTYEKLALLVGIDEYQYVTNLRGAVNDVESIKSLLVQSFGFPDDDDHIKVLTNGNATREVIISAIEEHLIAKAGSDTIVVFHYSGHGSQMKDAEDGDETDKYDETIVPADSGRESDGHPNQDITDDEINALLELLTEKTPNVTFIIDSCHSGTVNRGSGLARTVEPDHRPPQKRHRVITAGARGAGETESDFRRRDSRYALISGARAQELSYELRKAGKSYGAMTYALVQEIRGAGENATYRDIMDVVKARVSAWYPSQHPQLEGLGENQFVFSDKSVASLPYVLALPEGSGMVVLEGGQVQGVTQGSVYDVYPPGTKSFSPDMKPVAQVRVSTVDVVRSSADIISGTITQNASRAVEREHVWPETGIHVYFMDANSSETLKKIRKALSPYSHIQEVSEAVGYDLLLRELKGQDGKRYIATEGGDPTEISPRVAASDSDAVDRIVKQVTHWAKWFNILGISNQNPDLGIAMDLRAAVPLVPTQKKELTFTLSENEQFTIEVRNTSQKNIYIALLDLSSDGSVDLLYPETGQEEFIAPGKKWQKQLETFVPEGHDSVRDVLKIVATTQPADFGFLTQGPVTRGERLAVTRGQARNPLEELLANAAIGTTRGTKKVVSLDQWATVERVLEVRRKE